MFVSSRLAKNSRTSSMNPSLSVEKPKSFGSWLTMIVIPSPFMYPTCTSLGEEVGDEPELAQPQPDLDEPDEHRHHPGQRDRLGRVAARDEQRGDGGEDQGGDRRVGPEHEHA